MAFVTFEEIGAWQESRKLMSMIRTLCKDRHVMKDKFWVDQISRSCLSIMANISEGNDAQTDAEFIQFLGYAKRSAAETRSHLYYGLDEGYYSQESFNDMATRTKKIGAQLAKLISYLRKNKRTVRENMTVVG